MDPKLTRRLFAVQVTAAGAALTGCVAPAPAIYAPPVAVPRGTGITDADPNDGPGNGRGGGYRPAYRGTGLTDRDPNDGPGNGRGGGYRPAYRGTGLTDADPNDGPGNGRGGYRGGYRGRTDNDPRDAPGRGRW